MPQPTEAQDDFALDEIPPPPPVHYAEQALLGALLLEPHRLKTIGALLPEHFAGHSHQVLFTAMRGTPPPAPAEHTASPLWLNALLDVARPEAPGLTVPHLHHLVQSCPAPAHAAAYARMVRADHARRTLHRHAQQLAQAATDPGLPNPAAAVLRQADALAAVLDEIAGQFTPHPGSLPRTPLPDPAPRDTSEEALDEERMLLASATAHPTEVARMRWLQPGDFTLPLHAALFHCVWALAHRGDPVDPVTVLWEAQHRGLVIQDVTPAELMQLVATPAGPPEHWGQLILQRALLAQAHTAAIRVIAFTNDPANTPYQFLTGGRRALADLTALRARWQRTIPAKPPAPGPRTTATSRAGPPRTAAPTTRATR
ncbi:DnaB-like helicase N-terminal domain-containing protein [Streptomyces sp. NPDC051555]|uniref:DnaB-like helicase N-terminal domain-containing protein n=1 Tax=Streptomyces sp. NPDC051555 TaxID=3365657 RepID=UPI00378B00AA